MVDIIIMVNFIIGETEMDDFQIISSDLNQDGTIDILDVIIVVSIILES